MFSPSLDERIVRYLTRDAFNPRLEIKERALDRLGLLSDSLEPLITALQDADPGVRGTAAANLGRIRHPEAWPPLVRAVRDESMDDVLCHMVGALSAYSDPTIVEVLSELLASRGRDYRVRMEVVVQLWKYDPVAVRPQLVETLLSDDDEIVRSHAADSLELLSKVSPFDPALRQLWLRLAHDQAPGVAAAAAKALQVDATGLASSVLDEISRRLQHPAADERAFALHRLSMLAPASAVTLATPLLEDVDQNARIACCACLGAIRDDAAIAPLVAALRSRPEMRERAAVLVGLENYYALEIGDALLEMLETCDVTGDALSILCRQLWKYPSTRTVELLNRVLASSIRLPHRPLVESTLELLRHLETHV